MTLKILSYKKTFNIQLSLKNTTLSSQIKYQQNKQIMDLYKEEINNIQIKSKINI